ncbi:MAG: hypothetical protein QGF67_03440 [Lentisphaeria bacterium]|nr:hypothetical protein [Lentisphaeria bacterium]
MPAVVCRRYVLLSLLAAAADFRASPGAFAAFLWYGIDAGDHPGGRHLLFFDFLTLLLCIPLPDDAAVPRCIL